MAQETFQKAWRKIIKTQYQGFAWETVSPTSGYVNKARAIAILIVAVLERKGNCMGSHL